MWNENRTVYLWSTLTVQLLQTGRDRMDEIRERDQTDGRRKKVVGHEGGSR